MTLIETKKAGRPLYRVRWNYRQCAETNRKRYEERDFRDRAEAEAFEASITPITTMHTARLTVGELLTLWQHAHHPDHATGRTTPWQLRTRKDREQQANLRIGPFLGRDRVASLTPQRVEDWLDWMLEAVRHPDGDTRPRFGSRVAQKALQDLKTAVRWGRGKGIVENVYIDDVRGIPTAPPKPPRPFTPAEVQRIMDGCAHLRDATLIAVAAYGGLRWSELRGLQWGDISPDLRTIHIQRSIDQDRSIKLPKNGMTRTAALLRPGREALAAYRDALPVRPPTAWVFPNRNGDTLTAEWHRERLTRIREASGIHFDVHEMRDTYASMLIGSKEIRPEQIMLWLGHSSLQITLQRYARLYEAQRTDAADAADAFIASFG